MEHISDKDLNVVARQLDTNVGNAVSVVKRCSFGFPVTILSYPLKNGTPFPTIHYLTCPHLIKEISRLEEKGMIAVFETIIQMDEKFRKRVENAHRIVIEKRLGILEHSDKKWRDVLSEVGTGGIRDFTKVKCLHLHVADFLAGVDNPIGKNVVEMIQKRECNNNYCFYHCDS